METKEIIVGEVVFCGNILVTAKIGGEEYVALKPIVEGMGLDWRSQQRKISTDPRYPHMTIPYSTNGGQQKMLAIPLRKLHGWLLSVNSMKVHKEIREQLIRYQNECTDVLWNYWTRGTVINPRVEKESLKAAVREAFEEFEKSRTPPVPPTTLELDFDAEREKLRQEHLQLDFERATHLREIEMDLQKIRDGK